MSTESWESHVLPHGDLAEVGSGLWRVTGSLKNMSLPRSMTVHRLPDGGLWLHSVIALDEAGMAALEALGEPRVMVVPSPVHRLDAAVYAARYPEMLVVCPAAARAKVEELVEVHSTAEEALPPLGIDVHTPDGIKPSELVYGVPMGDGHALVFSDLLFNVAQHMPGLSGLIMRLLGSSGHFGMTRIGRWSMLRDAAALRAWLEQLAEQPGIEVLSVAHGDVITEDCAARLREAASRL